MIESDTTNMKVILNMYQLQSKLLFKFNLISHLIYFQHLLQHYYSLIFLYSFYFLHCLFYFIFSLLSITCFLLIFIIFSTIFRSIDSAICFCSCCQFRIIILQMQFVFCGLATLHNIGLYFLVSQRSHKIFWMKSELILLL